MSEPRVIKKYPNRRLYDTAESRYITLEDIRKLVVDHVDFAVVDKRTQADITNSILLQVIAEQEHGDPLMSRDFLSHIIRFYGAGTMRGVIGCYLEQTLKLFANEQRELLDRARNLVGSDPQEAVPMVVQRNYQRWRTVQDEIFRTLIDCAPRARLAREEDGAQAAGA